MSMPRLAPLVLAAHGSPHPAHRPAVLSLRDAVARASGGGRVEVGWLGFDQPHLTDAAAAAASRVGTPAWAGGPSAVVVPLLLTAGYHARVDVPEAVRDVPGVVVSAVLGPDELLAAALDRRLREAGARPRDRVVVAAAGTSDRAARAQTEQVAALLAARRAGPVGTAYATGPGERVSAAAARLPGRGPVFVATFLLGPGTLADRLAEDAAQAGGRATAPLGTAPEVIELVLRRWRDAAGPAARAA